MSYLAVAVILLGVSNMIIWTTLREHRQMIERLKAKVAYLEQVVS